MNQVGDAKIFDGNGIKRVDDATAVLMSEVLPLPPRAFMCAGRHLAALLPFLPGGAFFGILAHHVPHASLVQVWLLLLHPLGDFRAFGLMDAEAT